ncbi:MAG: O-antigen ligase family protein [Candidatus Hodarchaeota archaeon]
MLNILSIFVLLLAISLGYNFPRKTGWGILLIAPILGPATFTIVPAGILPLTIYRFAFAATIGISLSYYKKDTSIKSIFKSNLFKIVFIFSIFIILVSFSDRFLNLVFTFIPELFLAFILCFILIKDDKDLTKLVKIFVWQAAIIGIFIVLEYFSICDIHEIFASTRVNPNLSNIDWMDQSASLRAEFFRAKGIDGHPVMTSYRLTFLFPLVLWYSSRGKLIYSIPLFSVILGLVFLQTRAAFVGIFVALFFLVIAIAFIKNANIYRKFSFFIKIITIMTISTLVIVMFFPKIIGLATSFTEKSVLPVFSGQEPAIERKLSRIPRALDFFWAKPLLGYGSPQYVYYELMETDDLPSPLIYLLSGGLFLGLIYLALILYMPFSIFRLSRSKSLSFTQKKFLSYATAAFVGGVIVVFSNWQEAHFMIMFMLYISIYKVFFYKKFDKSLIAH